MPEADTQFKDEALRLTSEIAGVLHAYPAHAQIARELGETVCARPDQIDACYDSAAWWGGAGSMADLVLKDRAARAAYLRLLIRLVACFARAGYRSPRAAERARIFQRWLDEGRV